MLKGVASYIRGRRELGELQFGGFVFEGGLWSAPEIHAAKIPAKGLLPKPALSGAATCIKYVLYIGRKQWLAELPEKTLPYDGVKGRGNANNRQ